MLLALSSVSVIIPCLNEQDFIGRCLDSIIANDYPKEKLEVLVIDGMSQDHTREILAEYCHRHDFLKVLDNPKRITPAALNIGIKASHSEIVLRADAHAIYAPNYISTLTNGLDKYQADNVGGVRETALIHDTAITLALSIAISHPFTAGNAHFRIGSDEKREVDTVFCGCFRREIFDKVGYFNENIIRTEDRDFNARILESGGKIILDPSARCTYYPRTNFWEYMKWIAYGPYRLFYNHKFTHVNMASWRNFAPAAFVLSQFVVALVFLFSTFWGVLLSLPFLAYIIVAFIFSVRIAFDYRTIKLVPIMFLVFVMTHYCYGIGSVFGIPVYLTRRIQIWLNHGNKKST